MKNVHGIAVAKRYLQAKQSLTQASCASNLIALNILTTRLGGRAKARASSSRSKDYIANSCYLGTARYKTIAPT